MQGAGRCRGRLPPKSAAASFGDREGRMRQLCLSYARAHREQVVRRMRQGDEVGGGQMVLDAVGTEWDEWSVDELAKMDLMLELEREMYEAAAGDCAPEDCIDAQLLQAEQAVDAEVAYYASMCDSGS
eukprot:TRINITY_DN50389_c0_g1_i1.p1 TRINITY_DN50389_c0_g1~~TRINITY_DN50389_c0_g1_i1.p1  ORF type:complete len:128 (+),score=40.79 TRINITY_DN50389_c0_g1_i1:65-448(+)